MADTRTNLWTFIIYPGDSAPDNYLNIINSWHIPALLSPLHIPDKEEIKNHIHVMIYFGLGQKKSYERVMEDYVSMVNGSPAKRVDSRNGLARYFIHLDDPAKQQCDAEDGHPWTEDDLICLSGFQLEDALGSFAQDEQYYNYIEQIIMQHKIVNTYDLMALLRDTNCVHELRFFRRHTYYFNCIIDGNYKRLKKHNKNNVENKE